MVSGGLAGFPRLWGARRGYYRRWLRRWTRDVVIDGRPRCVGGEQNGLHLHVLMGFPGSKCSRGLGPRGTNLRARIKGMLSRGCGVAFAFGDYGGCYSPARPIMQHLRYG